MKGFFDSAIAPLRMTEIYYRVSGYWITFYLESSLIYPNKVLYLQNQTNNIDLLSVLDARTSDDRFVMVQFWKGG